MSPVIQVGHLPTMTADHRNQKLESQLRQTGVWHAALVIILAVAVLFSWQFDWRMVKRPLARFVSMNPLTAVFFILTSGLYLVQNYLAERRYVRYLVIFITVAVMVPSALRLCEIFWGLEFKVDQVLFASKLADEIVNNVPNRMAPNTAVCFLLLAPALAAMNRNGRVAYLVVQITCTLLLAISMLSLLGYLYQVPEFYGPLVNYTPMAIHTALCFFVLALSVLYATPDKGLIGVFTTRLAGSNSALLLIPAIILVPVAFGYLRLRGRWGEGYPIEFGVAVIILLIIVTLFALAWLNARALNRQHALMLESEAQLELLNKQLETKVQEKASAILRTESRLQHILDSMLEGIQIIDRNWVYLYANAAVARQARMPVDRLIGKRILDIFPGVEKTELFSTLMHTMQQREPQHLETPFEHPDGRVGWYEMSIQPIPEGIFILTVDITDRHMARQALVDANERLEARVAERTAQLKDINAELEAFSYSVSHDLKGPLHTLDGYAAMLEQMTGESLAPEAKEVLSSVRGQVKRMERLIKDLLDLAKLGAQAIRPENVDMRSLVTDIIADLRSRAATHAAINIQDLHRATADKELLRQVFYNLLANAFKYSARAERPHIEVFSEQNDRETIFHVRDNGIGYDMAFADKLFSPFQRLHKASDFEGSGIGLAIVQRIVHKHGGRVWAVSSPGQGATFSFSLPFSVQTSAA